MCQWQRTASANGVALSGSELRYIAPLLIDLAVALDFDLHQGIGPQAGNCGSPGKRRSVSRKSTAWLTAWRRTSIRP